MVGPGRLNVIEPDALFFGAVRVIWLYGRPSELETFCFGVTNNWSLSEWIDSGWAIPVLESYSEEFEPKVQAFLKRLQDGFKDKSRCMRLRTL